LWLIYIDHVSPDLLTWFTIRNYGFSDAAEIFIFISGFTAALVYGRATFEKGFVIGTARIARRVWQIYTAHLLLFLVLMAEIAFVTAYSGKQFYEHEMVVGDFFRQPGADMIQALFLRFRPLNMDVLPLYVVLMGSLPLVLLLAKWKRDLPLVVSIVLYIVANRLDLHFSTYPDGFWSFNPFGWQLLFVFGAWCALGGAVRLADVIRSHAVLALAIAYLVFSFAISLTWYSDALDRRVPQWLTDFIYPVDKANLDVLRFAHFLALATVTVRFVRRESPWLEAPLLRPIVMCGQHSLEIFCLGEFLSLGGHFANVELAAGFWTQLAVSVTGIHIMIATAALLDWYKDIEGRSRKAAPASRKADLAEGSPRSDM
jgi:hypothetical protein